MNREKKSQKNRRNIFCINSTFKVSRRVRGSPRARQRQPGQDPGAWTLEPGPWTRTTVRHSHTSRHTRRTTAYRVPGVHIRHIPLIRLKHGVLRDIRAIQHRAANSSARNRNSHGTALCAPCGACARWTRCKVSRVSTAQAAVAAALAARLAACSWRARLRPPPLPLPTWPSPRPLAPPAPARCCCCCCRCCSGVAVEPRASKSFSALSKPLRKLARSVAVRA